MIVVHRTRDLGAPAALQLATGALGTALAVGFLCPAVAAASFGALGDGRRYAGDAPRVALRGAFGVVAVLAAASVAYPFLVPHTVSGWPMLAFALIGLAVNAASVLAAIPERLFGLHPLRFRASSAGYAVLAGSGATALLRPEGWICVAGVVATMLVLAIERLFGRRLKQ